jgi:hypothetical protein
MTFDLNSIATMACVAGLSDMTKPSEGRKTLPPGVCGLRLVGYVETGDFNTEYQGTPKIESRTHLLFEVSGKKYPPVDGVAPRISMRLNCNAAKAPNSKSTAFKVFSSMNYWGARRNFLEMIGDAFKGTITVSEKGYANLDRAIGAPEFEEIDPDTGSGTGKVHPMKIPEATTPYRIFVFSKPTQDMWESIYIEGNYSETKDQQGNLLPAKSKNIFQNAILEAANFKGSAVEHMLAGISGMPTAHAVASGGTNLNGL